MPLVSITGGKPPPYSTSGNLLNPRRTPSVGNRRLTVVKPALRVWLNKASDSSDAGLGSHRHGVGVGVGWGGGGEAAVSKPARPQNSM